MSARSRAAKAQEVTLRALAPADLDAVLALEDACFREVPRERRWTRAQLEAHLTRFPEGQFGAVARPGDVSLDGDAAAAVSVPDGFLVGSCTNMRTTWEAALGEHTWNGVTGGGLLATHDASGDVLYGTEVMVHPAVRRRGLATRLFKERFAYVVAHGLRAFVTGARIPGYAAHAHAMKPQEYVDAVVRDDLTDPVLTADLKWGLTPRGVLCGYLLDPPSLHHAVRVVWENPERGG